MKEKKEIGSDREDDIGVEMCFFFFFYLYKKSKEWIWGYIKKNIFFFIYFFNVTGYPIHMRNISDKASNYEPKMKAQ